MNFLTPRNWWHPPRSRQTQKPEPKRHSLLVYQILLALLVVAFLTNFSSHQRPHSIVELRLHSEAPDDIRATDLFQVPKSIDELESERREAERKIPTILLHLPGVKEAQLARLDSVFNVLLPPIAIPMADTLKRQHLQKLLPEVVANLSEQTLDNLINILSGAPPANVKDFREACLQTLASLYRTGIVSSKETILTSVTTQVRIDNIELPVEGLHSSEELKRGNMPPLHVRAFNMVASKEAVRAAHQLLRLFIVPNLIPDLEETRRLRTKARRSIARIKRIYAQDDLIIQKGARVTQDHVDALDAFAAHLAERERKKPITSLLQSLAATVLAVFFTLIFGYYLATQEREVYQSARHLLLLAIIIISTAALASSIQTNQYPIYLVPTPLAAMLTTILISPQVGLVLSFLLALFVGHLFGEYQITLICAITSAIAVYSVLQVRHRNQFFRSMIFLPLSYILLIAATDLLRFVAINDIVDHILPAITIGFIAPILTMGLLPVFESLFRITTDITLLELSDLNRPLLRNLAIRAPGTYTHSLIMANLSESAAEAIGANALLARVGCYYHDIGKMEKSEYFTENQGLRGGRNPHDHLTPTMSTLVIISHVKDGLEMAAEYGLPKAISDLIPQHHGTTVMDYFYNRAIELGDESVREDDFRYDGPKPQTKEGGILMLADSVESAARSLSERTPNRVRQLVRNIIQQKFNAGELDECNLTLQDLHKIGESFIPILMGTLHDRIEYPWQKAERKAQKKLANPL